MVMVVLNVNGFGFCLKYMAISLLLLLKNTVFCVHPRYFVTRQRCLIFRFRSLSRSIGTAFELLYPRSFMELAR